MTPDLKESGTVVGLNNNSLAQRWSAPVMPHSPGKRCYRNTHCNQEY